MAARKTSTPVDVLVVDSPWKLVGARRAAGRVTMPGGVRVLSNCAGPDRIPNDLVVGDVFVDDSALVGRLQREWLEEMLDVLFARRP